MKPPPKIMKVKVHTITLLSIKKQLALFPPYLPLLIDVGIVRNAPKPLFCTTKETTDDALDIVHDMNAEVGSCSLPSLYYKK